MCDETLEAPVDENPADPYWVERHRQFVAVVEALADEGFHFSAETEFQDCFVSQFLIAWLGELTDTEIATLFDLSRQRMSAQSVELLAWLKVPMDHALNRDVRVDEIRKHLVQQELQLPPGPPVRRKGRCRAKSAPRHRRIDVEQLMLLAT